MAVRTGHLARSPEVGVPLLLHRTAPGWSQQSSEDKFTRLRIRERTGLPGRAAEIGGPLPPHLTAPNSSRLPGRRRFIPPVIQAPIGLRATAPIRPGNASLPLPMADRKSVV